jgi:hypothetical protein
MQIGTGRLHENVLQLPDFGTGCILPAPSGLVQQILIPGHALMDENVVGEGDTFRVTIKTARGPLAFPRRGDKFLMLVLMERGYSREIVRRLNRVRIHMQVLFLLDVLTVSGNRIDNTALQLRPATNRKSTLNWPKEAPTAADMMLWKEALEDICSSRRPLLPWAVCYKVTPSAGMEMVCIVK